MIEVEIVRTETGRVVSFEETAVERAERVRRAAEEASVKVQLSSGQRRVLARVQDRFRRTHPI